jgi:Tfp pilus assembly protein PilX
VLNTAQPPPAGAPAQQCAPPRHQRGQALVWIAVIAVFVALLCAAILLTAGLSRWAFATRAHTTAASAQPAQAILLRRPAATDDSTWPGQRG